MRLLNSDYNHEGEQPKDPLLHASVDDGLESAEVNLKDEITYLPRTRRLFLGQLLAEVERTFAVLDMVEGQAEAVQREQPRLTSADVSALPSEIRKDFLKRGQLWTKESFPPDWFVDFAVNEEERLRLPELATTRQTLGGGGRTLERVSKMKRGLASFVNGARLSVAADTGAIANVISADYVKRRSLRINTASSSFKLGNSSIVTSLGTVTIDYAFAEDPLNVFKLVCHVLPSCIYDLILGNVFLTATETMSKNRRRLTECLFSVGNVFHFEYLGNCQQFLKGKLAGRYESCAIPDTGAERNVMDLRYATTLTRMGFWSRALSL